MNFTNMILIVLLSITLLLAVFVPEAEGKHHHRKHDEDELDYKDMDEYEEFGVFVDAVPIKTTPHPKNLKGSHHKSNRLPKLRKFLEEHFEFFH
uniref:Uncharacterized protein n=1 Tax=Panagrolaimus sp. PS1159 TaxID=55785 RepID=A0AC35FF77_9BILA